MKKKICFVTGTRAEYGLLYRLIGKFYNDKDVSVKIIVTGMHLSNEFGNTYKEIISDGFKIDKKVKLLSTSDLPADISKSTGLAPGLEDCAPISIIETPSKSIFLHFSSILFLVRHFPPSKKESVVILSIPITFAVDKSSILPSILKVFIWKKCIFGLLEH